MTAHAWCASLVRRKPRWPEPTVTSTIWPNKLAAFRGFPRILLDPETHYHELPANNARAGYLANGRKHESIRRIGAGQMTSADSKITTQAIPTVKILGRPIFDAGGGPAHRRGHDPAG